MTPIVESEKPSRMVEIGVMAYRREDIENLPVVCGGIADAIGSEDG
jgi:hypothetical protein